MKNIASIKVQLSKRDWLIALALYVGVLLWTASVALSKGLIISDQMAEWKLYQDTIASGVWQFRIDDIVNSCLLAVFIPAWVARISHMSDAFIFWVWPCLFLSLSPAFIYLIARQYVNIGYAILTAMFVASNFYILALPIMGRVSIAFGLFPVLLWTMLRSKYVLAVVVGVLIVIAHYATAFACIAFLGVGLIVNLCVKKEWKATGAVLCPLTIIGLTTWLWHFEIAKESGRYAVGFVSGAINSALESVTQNDSHYSIWYLGNRETLVQIAFGATWYKMTLLERCSLIINWLMVFAVSFGAWAMVIKSRLPTFYKALAVFGFMMCVITVLIPYISVYYGIARVWYYFLTIGAVGLCWQLSKWNHRGYTSTAAVLVVAYGLFVYHIL